MTCERAHDDAAYLLGALSAAERDSYERHLGECAECRGELAGLSELPGLLRRLPAASVERFTGPETPGEWPADALLERILSVAGERRRAERRRARWRVAALAVAAACVALVVATWAPGLWWGGAPGDVTPSASAKPEPAMVAMKPVVRPERVKADLTLMDVRNGTQVRMDCVYSTPSGYQPGRRIEYVLVVTARDGRTDRLVSWRVGPGEDRSMTVTTRFRLDDIARVEVRLADDTVVLRHQR